MEATFAEYEEWSERPHSRVSNSELQWSTAAAGEIQALWGSPGEYGPFCVKCLSQLLPYINSCEWNSIFVMECVEWMNVHSVSILMRVERPCAHRQVKKQRIAGPSGVSSVLPLSGCFLPPEAATFLTCDHHPLSFMPYGRILKCVVQFCLFLSFCGNGIRLYIFFFIQDVFEFDVDKYSYSPLFTVRLFCV